MFLAPFLLDRSYKFGGMFFMSLFLVDYENVSASGLSGLEKLTEEDVVYIFYTENAVPRT